MAASRSFAGRIPKSFGCGLVSGRFFWNVMTSTLDILAFRDRGVKQENEPAKAGVMRLAAKKRRKRKKKKQGSDRRSLGRKMWGRKIIEESGAFGFMFLTLLLCLLRLFAAISS